MALVRVPSLLSWLEVDVFLDVVVSSARRRDPCGRHCVFVLHLACFPYSARCACGCNICAVGDGGGGGEGEDEGKRRSKHAMVFCCVVVVASQSVQYIRVRVQQQPSRLVVCGALALCLSPFLIGQHPARAFLVALRHVLCISARLPHDLLVLLSIYLY